MHGVIEEYLIGHRNSRSQRQSLRTPSTYDTAQLTGRHLEFAVEVGFWPSHGDHHYRHFAVVSPAVPRIISSRYSLFVRVYLCLGSLLDVVTADIRLGYC